MSPKIYIVTSGSYDDYKINAVFSHRDGDSGADAFAAALDESAVEEWHVDTWVAGTGCYTFSFQGTEEREHTFQPFYGSIYAGVRLWTDQQPDETALRIWVDAANLEQARGLATERNTLIQSKIPEARARVESRLDAIRAVQFGGDVGWRLNFPDSPREKPNLILSVALVLAGLDKQVHQPDCKGRR